MRFLLFVLTVLPLGWMACSEPGKRVVESTEDGAFQLTLKPSKSWVRSDEALPIQVILVSLNGPLEIGLYEEIEFVVNNGSLNDDVVNVVLEPGDEDYLGDTTFKAWITFRADPSTSNPTESQGEVHAFFRDALATLKIRIVASPDK